MGLFSGIKNNLEKSKASVIIQNLMEADMKSGLIDEFNPGLLANKIVDTAWNESPKYFDGSVGGVRPNKVTVATYSLAWSIANLPIDSESRHYCIMPFTRIIGEVYQNAALFNFNSVDNVLLDISFKVFEELSEELDQKAKRLFGDFAP